MIHFYGRVSTDHQENSAAHQRQVFEQLAVEMGEPHSIWIEEDVSGSVPLKERPIGRKVWDALAAGDTMVVTKLDRGWRSVEDAAGCIRILRQLGVKLKILDFPIDVSSDEGEMMVMMFATFAQYENRLRARRVREVFGYRKRNGLPYANYRPFGWARSGDRWKQLPEERETADRIASMREDGKTWSEITRILCLAGVKAPVKVKRKRGADYYTIHQVKGLWRARAAGYPIVPQAAMRGAVPAGSPA